MTGDNVIIMPGITNKYVTLGLGEVDQWLATRLDQGYISHALDSALKPENNT